MVEDRVMENLITIDMIDDWAGAAMQGLISSRGRDKDLDLRTIATTAYELAAEMARSRGLFIDDYQDELVDPEADVDGEDEGQDEDEGMSEE